MITGYTIQHSIIKGYKNTKHSHSFDTIMVLVVVPLSIALLILILSHTLHIIKIHPCYAWSSSSVRIRLRCTHPTIRIYSYTNTCTGNKGNLNRLKLNIQKVSSYRYDYYIACTRNVDHPPRNQFTTKNNTMKLAMKNNDHEDDNDNDYEHNDEKKIIKNPQQQHPTANEEYSSFECGYKYKPPQFSKSFMEHMERVRQQGNSGTASASASEEGVACTGEPSVDPSRMVQDDGLDSEYLNDFIL